MDDENKQLVQLADTQQEPEPKPEVDPLVAKARDYCCCGDTILDILSDVCCILLALCVIAIVVLTIVWSIELELEMYSDGVP